jgi:hypothetical protein
MTDISKETPLERGVRINRENQTAKDAELARQIEAQREKNKRDYHLWAPFKEALINSSGNLVTHNHPHTECPSRMNWSVPKNYR